MALVINVRGRVVESNQYKAFGGKDYAYKERPQATGYIGKEKDTESNLGDHGVRKYDADLGRFLCPYVMSEKSKMKFLKISKLNFDYKNNLNH